MPKIPSYKPKELTKLLQKNGFILLRSKGSHQMFHNPVTKKNVIVPLHKSDLSKGTLHSILKQAGIDKSEI